MSISIPKFCLTGLSNINLLVVKQFSNFLMVDVTLKDVTKNFCYQVDLRLILRSTKDILVRRKIVNNILDCGVR